MSSSPQSLKERKVSQSNFDKENPVSKIIVDCAFKIHKAIGAGLLESAYQECMIKEFKKREVNFKQEYKMPIYYDGKVLNTQYRVDFLVEDCVIVELKAVERILPIHQAQALTYLKLSNHKLALLVNFNVPLIKDGIKRLVI